MLFQDHKINKRGKLGQPKYYGNMFFFLPQRGEKVNCSTKCKIMEQTTLLGVIHKPCRQPRGRGGGLKKAVKKHVSYLKSVYDGTSRYQIKESRFLKF